MSLSLAGAMTTVQIPLIREHPRFIIQAVPRALPGHSSAFVALCNGPKVEGKNPERVSSVFTFVSVRGLQCKPFDLGTYFLS